jgi:hypothetical protein
MQWLSLPATEFLGHHAMTSWHNKRHSIAFIRVIELFCEMQPDCPPQRERQYAADDDSAAVTTGSNVSLQKITCLKAGTVANAP